MNKCLIHPACVNSTGNSTRLERETKGQQVQISSNGNAGNMIRGGGVESTWVVGPQTSWEKLISRAEGLKYFLGREDVPVHVICVDIIVSVKPVMMTAYRSRRGGGQKPPRARESIIKSPQNMCRNCVLVHMWGCQMLLKSEAHEILPWWPHCFHIITLSQLWKIESIYILV